MAFSILFCSLFFDKNKLFERKMNFFQKKTEKNKSFSKLKINYIFYIKK